MRDGVGGRDGTNRNRPLFALLRAAVIGSVYAALTLLLAPISYGLVQVRVSEALTVLPRFTKDSIPGLFVGCVLANLIGTGNVLDTIFGSLATLIAALISYKLKEHPWLVPLAPVVINAVVVGCLLYFAYGLKPEAAGSWALLADMGAVGLGQLVACYGLGMPLQKMLEKYRRIFD